MCSSNTRAEDGKIVAKEAQERVLTLGGVPENKRVFDPAELGFVGHVSEAAREEIIRTETRAAQALNAAVFSFRY